MIDLRFYRLCQVVTGVLNVGSLYKDIHKDSKLGNFILVYFHVWSFIDIK